ncbi:hypothetical protein SESBI_30118 [Sesbania bispinosa]|nr:hypothetical protein SESBI_30118 [Sesbania bispinosa]
MEDFGRKIGCPRWSFFSNGGAGVPADTPTLKSVCVADVFPSLVAYSAFEAGVGAGISARNYAAPGYEKDWTIELPGENDRICTDLGVRLPFSNFEVSILRYLNIAPSQLHPNAWGFIRSFMALLHTKTLKSVSSFFRPSEGGKRWLFKEDGKPKFPLYWSQDHYSRRSKDYVFSLDELTPTEIVVVEAFQAFKEKHGILGCHRILDSGSRSLKDRLGRPEKRVRMEEIKDSHDSGKGGWVKHNSFQPSTIFWGPAITEDFLGDTGSGGGCRLETIGSTGVVSVQRHFGLRDEGFPGPGRYPKLKDDEAKMKEALGKVKGLSDDNGRLTETNGKLLEEIEKLKLDLTAKKSEAIQAVLEKQKVAEDFEAAREGWKLQAAEYENEIQRVEDLWDESAECFFHNAIDQIKYLNPGTELRTKDMSTLCVVRDGKWYRGPGKYFMEELPGEEEITLPPMQPVPLEADAAREDKKGPIESEMVDAQVLGLDESKPPEDEAIKPPADALKG